MYAIMLTLALLNPLTGKIIEKRSEVVNTPTECITKGEAFVARASTAGNSVNFLCTIERIK